MGQARHYQVKPRSAILACSAKLDLREVSTRADLNPQEVVGDFDFIQVCIVQLQFSTRRTPRRAVRHGRLATKRSRSSTCLDLHQHLTFVTHPQRVIHTAGGGSPPMMPSRVRARPKPGSETEPQPRAALASSCWQVAQSPSSSCAPLPDSGRDGPKIRSLSGAARL